MQIKQKPYHLLFFTGLMLVLSSFFVLRQKNVIDIHLHDTYFVIAHVHIFWLLATISLLVWAIYLLTNKFLYSKVLTWSHVITTILTILLFGTILFFGDRFINPHPKEYYEYNNWKSFENYTAFSELIGVAIFALLSVQVLFVFNFIVGLIKRINTRIKK